MERDRILAWLNDAHSSLAGIQLTGASLCLGALVILLFTLLLRARKANRELRTLIGEAGDAGPGMSSVLKAQAELAGRLQSMAEIIGSRQAELTSTLAGRFDGLSNAVGRQLVSTSSETRETLSALGERLAVIDQAQNRIGELASGITQLQHVLGDKQTRGAFGELRMQTIVSDALPANGYRMQATLSNGKRPDCLIMMPNGAFPLAIDAKFPLDAYAALASAQTKEARVSAGNRLRRDMDVHIRAIATKYLIPGETLDTAIMFVPSEAVFAFLGEHFPDIIQKAYRSRVVIVSPTLLMLSVQVIQNLLKDAKVREEAVRIQQETRLLGEEIQRLGERVDALKTHFGQSQRDVDQILSSTSRILKRAERIDELPADTRQGLE
ncbi:DNA recombination protein RmuC [Fulvimarina endophytica]|uniref:DNA recombination protein RmuC homolog n=2 Tax=Fulvimarina endophytica TaxID=2293836 RepID=A0A371XAD6_9HYPH|nr:DNA recombination protein RmuC [Fulvimarina endophytica]